MLLSVANMKCLAAFVIISLCALAKGTPVCPEPELIEPCTCKIVAYGLNVVCADVKSSNELRAKFRSLSKFHVDNLLLHALKFSDDVSEELFSDMVVNVLQLELSSMTFSGEAFRGLENSLKQLKIMSCQLTTPQIKLTHLNKLQDFYFRKNKLVEITDDWLQDSIPKVRMLNLDNNDVSTIEENAFSKLSNLAAISLADNRISTVSRSMFPSPAFKLTQIDLSHNQLSSLPEDIFTHMPSLKKVVLSGNNLRSLPEKTWSEIWSRVNAVILYENQIVCDERIDWIKGKRKLKMLEGTCEEPAAVMGKPIKEVLAK